MDDYGNQRHDELNERLRLTEVENEFLTEQSEDILLLGLVAEAIDDKISEKEIIATVLERASILKELDYACFGQLNGGAVDVIQDYCVLFESTDSLDIQLPASFVSAFDSKSSTVGVRPDDPSAASVYPSTAAFDPLSLLAIPFPGSNEAQRLFVFLGPGSNTRPPGDDQTPP